MHQRRPLAPAVSCSSCHLSRVVDVVDIVRRKRGVDAAVVNAIEKTSARYGEVGGCRPSSSRPRRPSLAMRTSLWEQFRSTAGGSEN